MRRSRVGEGAVVVDMSNANIVQHDTLPTGVIVLARHLRTRIPAQTSTQLTYPLHPMRCRINQMQREDEATTKVYTDRCRESINHLDLFHLGQVLSTFYRSLAASSA